MLTDYDLRYFVDGAEVAYSHNNNPSGTEQPFECVNATVGTSQTQVDVAWCARPESTGTPRFKLEHIRSDLSGAEYTTATGSDVMGPNAIGHAVVPGGGRRRRDPVHEPTTPEPFSSRGPRPGTGVRSSARARRRRSPR